MVKDVLGQTNGSEVLVDFSGVEEISPSFANQFLRELMKKTEIEKIKFTGQSEVVSEALAKQNRILKLMI